MSAKPATIYLKDYQQPAYWIEKTHLTVELWDAQDTQDKDTPHSVVTARLALRQNTHTQALSELTLNGHDLALLHIAVNDQVITEQACDDGVYYQLGDDTLTLFNLPEQCELLTVVRIEPDKNTALEGLYVSGGMYCTQCEAEGFRRITYYLDRPDVMSVFTTDIIANGERYPTLLSNGNPVQQCSLKNGRIKSTWHDPHKKPAYLFALVAGDLVVKEDHFITASQRKVTLRIFVEPQNSDKTDYAMDALKRSMRWDEERYGREYDLDIFMIVAVDDFNMGAMENKGLNIFNSSCVLANPATATDATYQRIEAIVAHEYFHNWSGNRVTCRDWFQLSLKEGFTVFRDAQFSGDMNDKAVKRIEDVRLLRTAQFPEDAGPMAHPVQPDSFIEISNFYTLTVYEKGAEVVRMLHTLLGEEGFRKGSDCYFERHDGQAVTIHEFVAAMADANNIDLEPFKYWYKHAGTPSVRVHSNYDASNARLTLHLQQGCPYDNPEPKWIPINLALLDAQGALMTVTIDEQSATEHLVSLRAREQTIIIENVPSQPVLSLLRDFSAPVKLEYTQSVHEKLHLFRFERDGFSRWDAGQQVFLHAITQVMAGNEVALPPDLIDACAEIISDGDLDPAMSTYLLTLPSASYVAECCESVDPQVIHQARERVLDAFANALKPHWPALYERLNSDQPYQPIPEQMGARALKNLALSYWVRIDETAFEHACKQFERADNMTDQMAALTAVVNACPPERSESLLARFYAQWQHDSLVVNQWLSVQASSNRLASIEHINQLMTHEAFDWRNPNKVRSVLGVFASQALARFHSVEGYELLADAIIRLNASNPQIAARLMAPLTHWQRFDEPFSKQMKSALHRIHKTPELSSDVFEVVSKSLGE